MMQSYKLPGQGPSCHQSIHLELGEELQQALMPLELLSDLREGRLLNTLETIELIFN